MFVWRFVARSEEDTELYKKVKEIAEGKGTDVTYITKELWRDYVRRED